MIRVLKAFFKYFFLILLPLVTIWATYFFLYGNFHKVDNDVYRSAQLFSFNMPYYTKKNGIKSILNLRGKNDKKWYHEEIKFAQENNLTHYNYGIPDRRVISKKQMNEIVEIIKNAPKPILIHCKMGADRTSLAVALYLHAIKKDKNPHREISLLYGHFPWLGSKTGAMDKSFEVFIGN
ncbi:MAG: dual specificity protein phosphatase family protein [Sulfurovum sp.]